MASGFAAWQLWSQSTGLIEEARLIEDLASDEKFFSLLVTARWAGSSWVFFTGMFLIGVVYFVVASATLVLVLSEWAWVHLKWRMARDFIELEEQGGPGIEATYTTTIKRTGLLAIAASTTLIFLGPGAQAIAARWGLGVTIGSMVLAHVVLNVRFWRHVGLAPRDVPRAGAWLAAETAYYLSLLAGLLFAVLWFLVFAGLPILRFGVSRALAAFEPAAAYGATISSRVLSPTEVATKYQQNLELYEFRLDEIATLLGGKAMFLVVVVIFVAAVVITPWFFQAFGRGSTAFRRLLSALFTAGATALVLTVIERLAEWAMPTLGILLSAITVGLLMLLITRYVDIATGRSSWTCPACEFDGNTSSASFCGGCGLDYRVMGPSRN